MVKGVFPARYFPPPAEVGRLLRECEEHGQDERWARAWGCYGKVLERERGNEAALAGRERIVDRYAERVREALEAEDFETAERIVGELSGLTPTPGGARGLKAEVARAREAADAEAKRKREEATERKAEAEAKRREAEARRKAEEEQRIAELTPEVVRIKGGCFRMGSPESEPGRDDDERRHEVCVGGFSIGKHEVTFAEYDRFAEATGRSRPDDRGWGREDRPVINVSWDDATEYARWLSEETGERYRLPTEAEWEYAARAGTETAYPWGDRVGHNKANCDGCGSRWDDKQTAPVGSFEANAWGLHDTVGNVWEWTCSVYDGGYGGAERRCATGSAGRLVLRGGSWDKRSGEGAFRQPRLDRRRPPEPQPRVPSGAGLISFTLCSVSFFLPLPCL